MKKKKYQRAAHRRGFYRSHSSTRHDIQTRWRPTRVERGTDGIGREVRLVGEGEMWSELSSVRKWLLGSCQVRSQAGAFECLCERARVNPAQFALILHQRRDARATRMHRLRKGR